jgi:curli biogenesis system outer membrane secretion channel CsgG
MKQAALMRRIAANAILALAMLGSAWEPASAQKTRVAVLAFENNTTYAIFGDRLGLAASDEVTTQLVKSGEFSVIERRAIEAILAEQKLGASGLVDAATAARIGKLLGAQAVIIGSITKFSMDTKSGGIGPLSATYTEAESAMDVRVVDTTTGEIKVVAEGSGKKRFGGAQYKDVNLERNFDAGVAQEALRPAVEDAVKEILGQKATLAAAAAAAPFGQIVGARGEDFYLDRGENAGVKVGQRFDVVRVVDTISDASGTVLDEITEKVGMIEVTRVLTQSAIAKVVEGEAKQGDRIRQSSG